MKHTDHVNLLRDGVLPDGKIAGGSVWADLGSGRGAFTLALADLLGDQGTIISVDKDRGALRDQQREMQSRFPDVQVEYHPADFSAALGIPPLDGIVMANSLHYFRHKDTIVSHVRAMLKPGGRLIVVEYNVDRGNYAVPHPFTYPQWVEIAARAGFAGTRLLGKVPSSFLHEFYSALSINP